MSTGAEIVRLRRTEELHDELAQDVRAGLSRRPKVLPPKYFYDERGSMLFDRITELPEYYLTRAETSILEKHAAAIVERQRPDEIFEIGGGLSIKTRLLLSPLRETGGHRYVSLDVSEDALEDAARRLADEFPTLAFRGFVGDFEGDLERIPAGGRRLVAFLGSTIGNLSRDQRSLFLKRLRGTLGADDRLLLGVDLVKSVETLEAAYDDAAGVTADFNRNVLRVLNRELDGNLPAEDFEHRAVFVPEEERIEMRLRAPRAVEARLAAIELDVAFAAGEEMRTEISCKFRRPGVEQELASAGFSLEEWLEDEQGNFVLALAAPA